ncbi:MAG TPA: hydantoinase/oxoprolinase family protein [Stellaceae bacterium]|nr:hydantoinase/oxoprolinase family protein [Stellaceae bacterium]
MSARVLGWDIGGAHLKLALAEDGHITDARQIPCALWQGLDKLREAIAAGLDGLPDAGRHAVTMTGELADLFPDRASGVAAILEVLVEILGSGAIAVYGSEGGFLAVDAAKAAPDRVGSANWHATAHWLAHALGDGLLLDIGSTTTDIVPFRAGAVSARGMTDADRLATGELVYTGIVRTPLMAVARRIPFEGHTLGVMAEYFATAADAHRLAGTLPEGADLHPAADGRGKSPAESRARLARMIGMDAAAAPEAAWRRLAEAFVHRQIEQIAAETERVLAAVDLPPAAPVIGAGTGRFLAEEIARRFGRPYRSFESVVAAPPSLAALVADIAPAAAVALLRSSA